MAIAWFELVMMLAISEAGGPGASDGPISLLPSKSDISQVERPQAEQPQDEMSAISARPQSQPPAIPRSGPTSNPVSSDEEEDEGAEPTAPAPNLAIPETSSLTPFSVNEIPKPVPTVPQFDLPMVPSLVGAYRSDYEGSLSEAEARYQAMIKSGLSGASIRHKMEGAWLLSYQDNEPMVIFEFRQVENDKGRIDGAWRSLKGQQFQSGFLSDVTIYGQEMEINYIIGKGKVPHILHLRSRGDGSFSGDMMDPLGKKKRVTLRRSLLP